MRLRPHLHQRELTEKTPSFARGGEFAPLSEPFRAPITIASEGPGAVVLSTSINADAAAVPVHWEVSRDPGFFTPERYGLLLARGHDEFAIRVRLEGLERGRSYWARLWAGGAWSRSVRVRTGARANGSSTLALKLARRLQSRAS